MDVLHMRLETLQKQVEDQQEHICVLRDSVSLKDRQADMLHSDVTPALTRTRSYFVCLFILFVNPHPESGSQFTRKVQFKNRAD